MPDTSNISIGLIGMNTDLSPTNLDDKSYLYCLNGVIENFSGNGLGNLQNDVSNILAVKLPDGYKIIGHKIIIEQNRAILLLVNDNGLSLFLEYKNCNYISKDYIHETPPCDDCGPFDVFLNKKEDETSLECKTQIPYCDYRIITSSSCLGFNINYPVDIEYKITDCGLNIYFTDALNERRFVYFDYENGNVYDNLIINKKFLEISGYDSNKCDVPIYTNILDCNKIKVHPEYTKPCIKEEEVISGGHLKSGVYQFMSAYADVLGNELTGYTNASNPIPIRTKDIVISTDYSTDRAIKFKVINLDITNLFSYYNLVVAETIDNFTEFKLVGTFPTYTKDHTYTGNVLSKKLSASDIFFKRPYYKTAKSVTKANDYLFYAGLTEFPKYNLQPYAEMIKLYWETIGIEESVYSNPKNTNKYRSYLRDEVYPFGLILSATNGEELCVIHIPGPSKEYIKNYYDVDVYEQITTIDVIADNICDSSLRNKRWEVYNTGRVLGSPRELTTDCSNPKVWEYGEFSYHESTELYPNNPEIWGNLCGKPIRHFKFPDSTVTHIHDGLNDLKKYENNNIVFPIGVKIDANTVKDMLQYALTIGAITLEQYGRIHSYRLVRGNRAANKSVVAKGLLYDVWDYDKNNKKYYYSNYPYNDLRPDQFISNNYSTYKTPDSTVTDAFKNKFRPSGRYTFHSPDVHFTNPAIGTELKLETLEYGESEGFFNECDLQAKYKFTSALAQGLALISGLATALSNTRDKECTSYTVTRPTITTGTTPVGIVTGNSVAIITTPIPNPFIANTNFVPVPFIPYQKDTGEQIPSFNNLPVFPSSITRNTCRGSVYQELNKPVGVLSLLTGATLTGFLGLPSLAGIEYQLSTGLIEMKKVLELIETLIPYKNFFVQYNSIGKYNNYKVIPNDIGNKRRLLDRSAYLEPQVQLINEKIGGIPTTINFNNWNRESSVYLKIQNNPLLYFNTPSVIDNSRFTMGQRGVTFEDINKKFTSNISSYYGSIKNYVPDQYGDIFKIDYLETGSCTIMLDDSSTNLTAFGGDTFITRFALKRKMSFFLNSAFKLQNNSDIRQQDVGNVGYPNYYLTSGGSVGENLGTLTFLEILLPTNIPTLFGTARNRLDVDSKPFFYQKGRVHLYNYGIPYFLVESDINTDYRHGTDLKDNDFYPHTRDLENWLQEKNVPITVDNSYNYNTTFSKQNKESFVCINNADYAPTKICKSEFPFRVIYSEQNQNNGSSYDNWLVFKANNYHDFPITNGRLITADGIENDKILVRFENTVSVFSAYNTIQTDSTNIQVGTGGIFQSRPKNFSSSSLGYGGSQHRALLETEFGRIWADSKRGQVFQLSPGGDRLEEIAKDGMKNWFKENLPFTITKYFPNINVEDIDNNYKGIGIHMSFDKKFNRFLLTKLDYAPIINEIFYKDKDFYVRTYLPDTNVSTTSCAPGYTLLNGLCVKTTSVPATFVGPIVPFIGTRKQAIEYSSLGSCIYTSFSANGTGVFNVIPYTNLFWYNPPPYTGFTGPLNRVGIWNSLGNDPIDVWLDISVRVDVPETKTYYIGIAGDNITRIKLGCDTIMEMDEIAMGINHGFGGDQIPFKRWHIYPITLSKGIQYVTVGGYNYGSISAFGAEIYNNTYNEIFNATSYDNLNIVYSTLDLVGKTVNTIGWVCDAGCATPIENADGTFSCLQSQISDAIIVKNTEKHYIDEKISVTDPNYFCNKSWTISYNFINKSWVSYHSFLPNVYLDWIDYFQTSDQTNIWSHSITNSSYQVYNGVLCPFIIELISKPEIGKSYLTNISYMLDTVKYSHSDNFYNDVINFNKVILYNNKQCTGLLNLVVTDPEDFSSIGTYPRRTTHGIEVETHNAEGMWSVNDIFDVSVPYNNKPLFINNCANSYKELNYKALNYGKADLDKSYLRNDFFKIRLINDKTSKYHFIFKYLINNSKKSIN